jgi:hypothetical protein
MTYQVLPYDLFSDFCAYVSPIYSLPAVSFPYGQRAGFTFSASDNQLINPHA